MSVQGWTFISFLLSLRAFFFFSPRFVRPVMFGLREGGTRPSFRNLLGQRKAVLFCFHVRPFYPAQMSLFKATCLQQKHQKMHFLSLTPK